jgi:hypothetical protein
MNSENWKRVLGLCAVCAALAFPANETLAAAGNERIVFLHHSTGGVVWENGVPQWFAVYNAANGTDYRIENRWYPQGGNDPYDYWNVWVNHAGNTPHLGDDTLEILTQSYDVIAWKHCYPLSEIEADIGAPDVASTERRQENYRLQYEALKTKMRSFPTKTFVVWTGAVHVQANLSPERATRMRSFVDWVRNIWDEPGDNIFVWDFYELETDGGLYLRDEYSAGGGDSHPNAAFGARVAPLFGQAIVDAITATSPAPTAVPTPTPSPTSGPTVVPTVAGGSGGGGCATGVASAFVALSVIPLLLQRARKRRRERDV